MASAPCNQSIIDDLSHSMHRASQQINNNIPPKSSPLEAVGFVRASTSRNLSDAITEYDNNTIPSFNREPKYHLSFKDTLRTDSILKQRILGIEKQA